MTIRPAIARDQAYVSHSWACSVLECIVVRREHRGDGIEKALLERAELLGAGPALVYIHGLHGAVAALVPNATKIEAREFLT